MIDVDIEAAATALAGAEERRVPIEPLTGRFDGIDVSGAYRIQLSNARRRVAAGETVRGHKVGLTAPAMQELFGVDEPDFGHLFDSMFVADGGTILLDSLIAPQVEVEPAFILAEELRGPDVTPDDVMAATEAVVPALEIIDSRIADWQITLPDTIADNASSGGLVLGSRPVRPESVDLSLCGCLLHRNGRLTDTGAGGAVLGGSPVNALVWLANVLGERGVSLEAGHVILPGSVTAAIPVSPGDTVSATFDRIGTVSLTFSEK